MTNFQSLNYKSKLKNAQHFAFIQAFITSLQAANFSAAKISAKLAELVSAFGEEDRWYMIVRASEVIAQRTAADEKRDRFYSRLHRLIQAWAGSGMAQLDAAATALERYFKLYKLSISAQMDEETGVLDNLITDISTPEMQTHIATINGTYLFQQMVEGQNLVKSLRLEEGVEQSEKVYGGLSAARKRCDALYDEMCDLIKSFANVADDPAPYETFITRWNGTVKIYQDMLDRKSGNPITNNSGTESGSGSGSGSSQGTGGSETPDPGTGGGETPDPGTGGGETPDPGTGGGTGTMTITQVNGVNKSNGGSTAIAVGQSLTITGTDMTGTWKLDGNVDPSSATATQVVFAASNFGSEGNHTVSFNATNVFTVSVVEDQ